MVVVAEQSGDRLTALIAAIGLFVLLVVVWQFLRVASAIIAGLVRALTASGFAIVMSIAVLAIVLALVRGD